MHAGVLQDDSQVAELHAVRRERTAPVEWRYGCKSYEPECENLRVVAGLGRGLVD